MNDELRLAMNTIVGVLNSRVLEIVQTYVSSKMKQGDDGNSHAPGWARNRLFVVNPDDDWDGHRFCEPGAQHFDDPSIFFIPFCDRANGESDEEYMTLDQFKLDPDTCNSTEQYGTDWTYTYECEVSRTKKHAPESLSPDARFMVPESYAKVFHPRPNGHKADKERMTAALLHERPPRNQEGQTDECRPMELFIPNNETILYQHPRPEGERLCLPGEHGSDDPGEQPHEEPPTLQCFDLATRKFGRRQHYNTITDGVCDLLTSSGFDRNTGHFEEEHYKEEMEWVKYAVSWTDDKLPRKKEDCLRKLERIFNECDTDPQNTENMDWKAGGELKDSGVTYRIEPVKFREPWAAKPSGGCIIGKENVEIWGRGWSGSSLGSALREEMDTPFENDGRLVYETREDGREWTLVSDLTPQGKPPKEEVERLIKTAIAYRDDGVVCDDSGAQTCVTCGPIHWRAARGST
jgi:hypothetical protein